jgi:type I restriction-modification system DNA methylase subunit
MLTINRQDASDVERSVDRFFASTGTGRAQALRSLFVETLDFANATGFISLGTLPKNSPLPIQAERIASLEGLHVVYIPLTSRGPDQVRKSDAVAAAKIINDTLHGDLLLVMTNPTSSQLHFISPTFVGATSSLRRITIARYLPKRTAVEQLSKIYNEWKSTGSIRLAVEKAFDVEAVTKWFFEEYKRVFDDVLAVVKGFGRSEADAEAKKLFVQTLFNRLMFTHFLSRKRWLKFNGEFDYLNALWGDHVTRSKGDNFYETRLKALFFDGMNKQRSEELRTSNPELYSLIGDPPFLNGGLFDHTEDDKYPDTVVPDAAIDLILHQLFDKFNFTVMESTPLDAEVAVDPEMLGKVFEEVVTGRHESGSYYTPRPVVSFMCREALKGYLETQHTGASNEAIKDFVDNKHTSYLMHSTAPKIGLALEGVKVIDPALGSGAYLLGMMQELVELRTALYSSELSRQPQDLYQLKLRIIEQNLYGADVDQFAVNIAMLRLWLSLAVEYDGDVTDLPPLPNLDFKIVCGDSLLGPDPSPDNYGDLFRYRIHELAGQMANLKQQHIRETGAAKIRIAKQIEVLQDNLREVFSDSAAPEKAIDWRVEFAEVFDQEGGFDVVVANPPYVRIQALAEEYVVELKSWFSTARGKFDLYVPFAQRATQLMKSTGRSVLIMPNKYLVTAYGRHLLAFLEGNGLWQGLLDFGDLQVFSTATNYTCISIFARQPIEPVVKIRKNPGENVDSVVERYLISHCSNGQLTDSTLSVQELASEISAPGGLQLGDVAEAIFQGIISGGDPILYLRDNNSMVAEILAAGEEAILPALLKGSNVERYRSPTAHWRVVYPYAFESGRTRLFGEDELEREFPVTYAYLLRHRAQLASRGSERMNYPAWFALWCPRDMAKLQAPKILTQVLAKCPSFTFDQHGDFGFVGGGNAGVYGIILKSSYGVSPNHYLAILAVLNSFAMKLWAISRGTDFRGGYMSFGKRYIEGFPIPEMNDNVRARLAAMAEASISGQNFDGEIDSLVANLYGVDLNVSMEVLAGYA